MAESARTPPFLLQPYCLQTKVVYVSNCIGASVRWTWIARVATSLRASLMAFQPVRGGLTKNLDTNQCATRRDRTNVCMCHLDHLLQLPWAESPRVPPTEAARLK